MKVLLVGPCPPPHGGVSVHVARAAEELRGAGIDCRILNTDRNAPPDPHYLSVRSRLELVRSVLAHAQRGWTVHVHVCGHNLKAWILALGCGLAARLGGGRSLLSLHSGMTGRFLRASLPARLLVRLVYRVYSRVVCVSAEIRDVIERLGARGGRLVVQPAFLPVDASPGAPPLRLRNWMRLRGPLLSTATGFGPEYGFELLVEAVARLRLSYPGIGLVVMGTGERAAAAKDLVERERLTRSIFLAGDLPHHDCLSVMSCSALFVRPSLADGDAVSVREALALGVRVVASDAAERPDGTTLCAAGSVDDLVAKIEETLSGPPPHGATAAPEAARALVELYA